MDVEQRWLDAVNAVKIERGRRPSDLTWVIREDDSVDEAACRLIEQHDAKMREVSDAVKAVNVRLLTQRPYQTVEEINLSRFILSDPVDDLTLVCKDMGYLTPKATADHFREALARRGLSIVPTVDGEGVK